MPAYIIHKDGVYNFYSTISDACWFKHGITLDQLREYVLQEHGRQGAEVELPARLERAHETGCSGFDWTLDNCITGNRAGARESKLSRDEFIAQFLTIPAVERKKIFDDQSAYSTGFQAMSEVERQSSARLIAAAPDLLEAVKAFKEAHDLYQTDADIMLVGMQMGCAYEMARASIAKATGVSSIADL